MVFNRKHAATLIREAQLHMVKVEITMQLEDIKLYF